MMGTNRSGAFQTMTAILTLMIVLSIGLYIIALNPSLGGFSVEASGQNTNRFAANYPAEKQYPTQRANTIIFDTNPSEAEDTQQRPECTNWYRARKGDSQWSVANQFTNEANKWPWIKGMRWVSGKKPKDESLKVGESICVSWELGVVD